MYAFETYRKGFLMGADGHWYEVSEEIWTEYIRSVWREEAARRREGGSADRKKKGNTLDSNNDLPKVVSYESISDAHGEALLPSYRSTEDEVVGKSIRTELYDRLYRALEELGPEEKFLIGKLYLEGDGMSIREYAAEYGAPRTTVQYQRTKLLKKLRTTLESEDGFSLDTVYAAFEQNEG